MGKLAIVLQAVKAALLSKPARKAETTVIVIVLAAVARALGISV